MLKFVKHTMETIEGIEIFPLVSFVIFFTFFIGLLYWVKKTDSNYVNHLEKLPLEEDE